MNQLAQEWMELDKPYAANEKYGLGEPNSVHYTKRHFPLLLVAAHAVHHDRNGKDKKSDARTGGLCEVLGKHLNASTLAAAGYMTTEPEWEDRTDEIKRIVDIAIHDKVLIIDLHGMADSYGIDICLGVGEHPTSTVLKVAKSMSEGLRPYKARFNEPFAARAPYTIRSYVESQGGECIQIELAKHLRSPEDDETKGNEFVQAMLGTLGKLVA